MSYLSPTHIIQHTPCTVEHGPPRIPRPPTRPFWYAQLATMRGLPYRPCYVTVFGSPSDLPGRRRDGTETGQWTSRHSRHTAHLLTMHTQCAHKYSPSLHPTACSRPQSLAATLSRLQPPSAVCSHPQPFPALSLRP